MNDNFINLVFILDRSGSMHTIWSDTIGGFNNYIKEQREYTKKENKEMKVTFVAFDDQYDKFCELENIKDFDIKKYNVNPRGYTALLDAIGKTVNSMGETLNKMKEDDKPAKTIVVIMTDGLENDSKEFNKSKIKEMIEHQQNMYKWDFVYIGANQDSFAEAGGLGISMNTTMNYKATSRGVKSAYFSLSNYTQSVSSGNSYDLSNDSQN